MYLCMCICIKNVCMYVSMYVWKNLCMYVSMYVLKNVCMYVCKKM